MTLKNPKAGTGKESLGFLIQLLSNRIEAHLKIKLEILGVDIKIFANLMMLSYKDGINQREIGKNLDFPEYYTSRNVDALVAAGFAERRKDPNSRRSILIYLTKTGREKAVRLPEIVRQSNKLFLSGLAQKERAELIRLLQKTNDMNIT